MLMDQYLWMSKSGMDDEYGSKSVATKRRDHIR